MTVFIINSKIKQREFDGIVLDENDFHPCHPFFIDHPNIKPESVDKIVIKGIFERCIYKRAVLRYCDYMLAKDGIMEIYFYNAHFEVPLYVRSRNDWQFELSLVFGDRILLLKQNIDDINGFFEYKKIERFLPSGDTINRWSFGIVSSGRMNERVLSIIHQIISLNIPEFEILVCGPSPCINIPSCVRVLDDKCLYPDIRIPISKKKNYIIEKANYNNIVLMHDRFNIPESWYANMKIMGNYFDILVCNIYDENNHTIRISDWACHYPNPFPQKLTDVVSKWNTEISKEIWNDNIYIPGGFFIFKKHFGIKLNPNLNWGEKEDVDFCRRAYGAGLLLEFDPNNDVYCTVVRYRTPKMKVNVIRRRIRRFCYKAKLMFRFYNEKNKFYSYLKRI